MTMNAGGTQCNASRPRFALQVYLKLPGSFACYCSGTRSAMSSHMTGLEGSKPPVTAWMAV